MNIAFYLFATTVRLALQVIYFSMFIQAILSWFLTEDHPIVVILTCITAPVVIPVRALLSRIPALQSFPIDISFLVAFLLLSLVQSFLPVVTL